MIGQVVGSYRITAKLGAGGMGEVYRARDTKLDRDVAIKVLPEALAQDPDRLARFEREAKVLASLNHPNIAHIYGIEERALVMELVEGATLYGPLPLETSLNYAKQIADALEAAHEKGITHRDLKPANIMITPAGVVKVLDFGLAAVTQDPASISADPANSPTLTMRATQMGMIMGTAAYMSPEQARGKPVDKRADIWAFGVVLYEMLTGEQLFPGEDVVETLAAVVHKEPDWNRVPARVRGLLKRCLEKDPKKRLRDIGEAWYVLEESPVPASAPSRSRFGWMASITAAGFAIALAGLAFVHFREKPPVAELMRFQIPPPGKSDFADYSVVLSPDGRRVAFVVPGAGGVNQLWVRSLDSLEARPLAGSDGVLIPPFWSPDSRFLGFGVAGKLKKVDVSGGPPQTVCDLPRQYAGGAWSTDGVIIFGALGSRLMRVPETGGAARPLTELDPSSKELYHDSPVFLPDGRHFLYQRYAGRGAENTGIYLGSLDTKPEQQSTKRLVASDQGPVYAPVPDSRVRQKSGYLLFFREGSLMAQPFDLDRLELTGEAVPVAEGFAARTGPPAFSASMTGILAYRTGGGSARNLLTWFDREGMNLGTAWEPGEYNSVALSPDGTRVAVSRIDSEAAGGRGADLDLWVYEFARGISTRLTFGAASNWLAAWSPDGSRIIFSSARDGPYNLFQKASSGAGSEESLLQSSEPKYAQDWSRDGRFLMYSQGAGGNLRLWVLPLEGERKPTQYLKTEFYESGGRFSPDGHYVAYTSDASGRREIYVQPFPNPQGGKWVVSRGGGVQPRWRSDGKELFYISADSKMMAVEVSITPVFKAGVPKALFAAPISGGGNTNNVTRYDVTADGKKFLINSVPMEASAPASTPITVVLNWQAGLKK